MFNLLRRSSGNFPCSDNPIKPTNFNPLRPSHPWIQGISRNATLAWIPGRCGIPGNIVADQLAGIDWEARRFTDEVPVPDIKKWISKVIWNHWAPAEKSEGRGLPLDRLDFFTGTEDHIAVENGPRAIRLQFWTWQLQEMMRILSCPQLCRTCTLCLPSILLS